MTEEELGKAALKMARAEGHRKGVPRPDQSQKSAVVQERAAKVWAFVVATPGKTPSEIACGCGIPDKAQSVRRDMATMIAAGDVVKSRKGQRTLYWPVLS